MIDTNSIQKELEKFGLSKNQATIYLLLVQHKELRIQEIAQLTNIPRSMVYECLKSLFELGIAEEMIGENHKTIRPYTIGIIKHRLNEKIFHLQKLTADLHELEKAITITTSGESAQSTSIRYYKNRSGARQLYWNTLRATNTVYTYNDWGRFRYVGRKFYESFVLESHQRDIKERVLINISPDALKSIKMYNVPGHPIARTRLEDIGVLDKKVMNIKGDTIIYDNIYAQVYLKNIEINGFEIESAQFVQSQRSIFETLWKMAQPIKNFL